MPWVPLHECKCNEENVHGPLADLESDCFPVGDRYDEEGEWIPAVPSVLVVDDFYSPKELAKVMRLAHSTPYGEFEKGWYQSRLYWSWDYKAGAYADLRRKRDWVEGHRHASASSKAKIESITQEKILNWTSNSNQGVFNYKTAAAKQSSIHHHYTDGELWAGWVGVIFLSDSPESTGHQHGTRILRHKRTQLCVTDKVGMDYSNAEKQKAFDVVHTVEFKENRLLLFREAVWHQAPPGWGNNHTDSRLFQTLFLETCKNPHGPERCDYHAEYHDAPKMKKRVSNRKGRVKVDDVNPRKWVPKKSDNA